ncbi:MAG: FG-GAP repeat domain-containing protein [Thermoguttaceae bacterium]
MKNFCCCITLLSLFFAGVVSIAAETTTKTAPQYKKMVLSDQFYAEGSHYGDINKDGHLDVVAGPFWYEGPDFTKKHEIYSAEAFKPEAYSDNFTVFVADLNGDSWPDVFVCPHPGTQGYWYENPRDAEGKWDKHWTKHLGPDEVGNESQQWADIYGDGHFGPIYNKNGFLGFSTFDVQNDIPSWTFHAVSPQDARFQKYTHGIGFGDINGDGRADLIERLGWWEQPEDKSQTPWTFHPFTFADAAAHLLVYDIDGDGLNDVVTAWHCHLYGLVWYKQVRGNDGTISWQMNEILPITPDVESNALRISQMHAFDLADFNGDGLLDFVTGKRYWAHGPKGDKEPDAPAVVYWFELVRGENGKAHFVPHQIDDNSGVGTQVTAVDLNKDNVPDIIVSNKKGTFVFLSETEKK